jgi:hypothetical protein
VSAQESLAQIGNMGTKDIRVACHVTALNAWSATESRDTFRHFVVTVSINKVGVGPLDCSPVSVSGKNLDAICDRACAAVTQAITAQNRPILKKKLKRKS